MEFGKPMTARGLNYFGRLALDSTDFFACEYEAFLRKEMTVCCL